MARPHPFAHPPRQVAAFDFLLKPTLATTGEAEWYGPVATVMPKGAGTKDERTEFTLTDDNDPIRIKHLYDAAVQSAVGKGEETVVDEDIRSSREITTDSISLEPKFAAWVAETVADAGTDLNHPVPMVARLYKVVLYAEGDEFHYHMDAPHSGGMIATFSVELFAGEREGGELQFKDIDDQPHATKNLITWSLFYHDVKHRVTKVEEGWRVSLVFDVFESGVPKGMLARRQKKAQAALLRMKREGARRVGFMLNHTYMEPTEIELEPLEQRLEQKMPKHLAELTARFLSTTRLKGWDRAMYHFFQAQGLEPRLVRTCVDDNGNVFDRRLVAIFYLNDAFDTLFRHREHDQPDPEEEEDAWDQREKDGLPEGVLTRSLEPRLDPSGQYEAVAESCLMGDVVFLRSDAASKKAWVGDNEEVHLGNNGFQGVIHSNLAMIVSLSPLQSSDPTPDLSNENLPQ